jgi:hypothetical protein
VHVQQQLEELIASTKLSRPITWLDRVFLVLDGSVKRHDRDIVVKDEAGSGVLPMYRSLPEILDKARVNVERAEEQLEAEVLAGKDPLTRAYSNFAFSTPLLEALKEEVEVLSGN